VVCGRRIARASRPITSREAVEAAAHEFKDRLKIIENRIEKDAGYFDRPELLYGALRWLATTYHGAKAGLTCPDLDESCRRVSGFRYTAHQSEVTMGQYASDYEVTWRGKLVKLREHIGFGTSRDRRHTIRVAFFFDDKTKRVVVGYVGLHQTSDYTSRPERREPIRSTPAVRSQCSRSAAAPMGVRGHDRQFPPRQCTHKSYFL
jgi:hypothetical protein